MDKLAPQKMQIIYSLRTLSSWISANGKIALNACELFMKNKVESKHKKAHHSMTILELGHENNNSIR